MGGIDIMGKKKWQQHNENRENKGHIEIQGFDIDLNQENLARIEYMVDRYESEILNQLNTEYIQQTKWLDRLVDRIAQFGGSWKFIIWSAIFLVGWMVWNSLSVIKAFHFDEPPFILLNLCLSCIAAFQAPVIMMSQNRQTTRDKQESIIDFAINYKAEQEIAAMKN